MLSTVHLYMSILYSATILLMLLEGIWTGYRMRHAPQEVLQLRLFGVQESLNRALIALTVAIIMGIIEVLPITLEFDVPDIWFYATGAVATALAWYAIIRIGPMFRVPGAGAPGKP